MITCFLKYEVDMHKLSDFENYAKMWILLIEKFGGKHHGYFLPSENISDIAQAPFSFPNLAVEGERNAAYALFSFPNFAAYEDYRQKAATDEECQNAMAFYQKTKCFRRYERSFLRPIFEYGLNKE